jgi:cytochrome c oxidase subunit 2
VLDNEILTLVATPIFLLIVVFLGYVLVVFRPTGPEVEEGPRIYGHAGAQTTWIVASTAIVLALFAYGTWRLLDAGAAGGGQGPSPLSPAGGKSVLPVQVIGQQWQFTYRYPTYGGLETARLVLPLGRTAELHVTSLDVIHSFWAYQLGVKADANPGVDNIVYVTPTRVGTFDVRCAEICGIWHGYMFDKGRVVSQQEFEAWIRDQQRVFGPVLPYLPPYGRTYLPDPQRRAG